MHVSRRAFLRAALACPVLLSGCRQGSESGTSQGGSVVAGSSGELQRSFFCFDTTCAIGGVMSQDLLDEAVERCLRFEGLLSRTIDTSDVSAINSAEGEPVTVDADTAELVARALEYSAASGGLFDITIGAVTSLWDFHEGIVPAQEAIEEALPHVDYRKVQVDGQVVTLEDADARIDLGGIAKGFVADKVIDLIAEQGVESGYVNLGGNVKVLGAKPDGTPWRVGVRDPDPEADSGAGDGDGAAEVASVARVALEGGSVVTSGLYERQFEKDGRRYWHILDPRTGYPVESDLVSATIVSERSLDGDGYTKPLFMMDAEAVQTWAEEHADFKLLLIDQAGSIEMYPKDSFELL